ncbi:MAG: LmbE family protein [Bacteroidetes bacterium]|nr:LmbE family protein [Bacteroidota bacterium]
MSRRQTIHAVIAVCLLATPVPVRTQQALPRTSSEIKLALDQLPVLGSVLYVAAHPDDENTAFLAAMARGRGLRTAYLSMTRGEGGQNLIGPEQGAALGVIRTQELLAARRIDGAEQYFTRAIDFGYSKTTEETLRFWGHDSTLADVVWVIRTFRPDVIVTRFTSELGGHGNHTASALLAIEAFDAAADPHRFPGQLRFTEPWRAKRLVWNMFQHLRGDTAFTDLFDGIPLTWSRVRGGDAVERSIADARAAFSFDNPSACLPALFRVSSTLAGMQQDPWVSFKRAQVDALIQACAGLWVDLSTQKFSAAPGSEVPVTLTVVSRSNVPFRLEAVRFPLADSDSLPAADLQFNRPFRLQSSIHLPGSLEYSQPHWLRQPSRAGAYRISSQQLVGLAETPSLLSAQIRLTHPEGNLTLALPLQCRTVDPVDGESYVPFAVTPPVSIRIREGVLLFSGRSPKTMHVSLLGGEQAIRGTMRVIAPLGWKVSPAAHTVDLPAGSGEALYRTVITPPQGVSTGEARVQVEIGEVITESTLEALTYKHIPRRTFMTPARTHLLRSEITSPGGRAAYIMGAGDDVPAALQQLGYRVDLLSDDDLALADFTVYDVVVAGIRAYNTRPALRRNQERLMDYVSGGGTYVVQYVTPQRGEGENIGPYPLFLSRDRVSDEDAPVSLLVPAHPVFTTPNRITSRDFDGWVQERGLYFAERWDPRYDSVLSCKDPGEPERRGGLLIARHGKGIFVYNGYAFFRQLPAGVEGAYRLFANILALRQRLPAQSSHGRIPGS